MDLQLIPYFRHAPYPLHPIYHIIQLICQYVTIEGDLFALDVHDDGTWMRGDAPDSGSDSLV
jgi:hypothetical protein